MKKKTMIKVTSGAMVAMLSIHSLGMATPVSAATDSMIASYASVELTDNEMAEAVAAKLLIPRRTRDNITLPTSMDGAKITYKSSNSWVLSTKGSVHNRITDTDVTLTAKIQYGKASFEKDYLVTVFADPSYAYGYNFTDMEGQTAYPFGSLKIMGGAFDAKAYLRGNSMVENDKKHNKVVHISSEQGDHGVNFIEYSRVIGIMDYEGFTINMWVNPAKELTKHNVLFEASNDNESRLRIDGELNCRINANGVDYTLTPNTTLKQNEWQFVTFAMDCNSAKLYVNGKLIEEKEMDFTACLDRKTKTSIQDSYQIRTGYGVYADDEDIQDARFADIFFFEGKMNTTEINIRYLFQKL